MQARPALAPSPWDGGDFPTQGEAKPGTPALCVSGHVTMGNCRHVTAAVLRPPPACTPPLPCPASAAWLLCSGRADCAKTVMGAKARHEDFTVRLVQATTCLWTRVLPM